MHRLIASAVIFSAALVASASAETQRYVARLDGAQTFTQTGSAATADASLAVDDAARTVDFTLTVQGLSLDGLAQHLVHAPVGPVHLHIYSPDGDVKLLLPFPYGENYTAIPGGFRYAVRAYSYDEGAHFLGSPVAFEDFLSALQEGYVYVNVHTGQFRNGEISGTLTPAR